MSSVVLLKTLAELKEADKAIKGRRFEIGVFWREMSPFVYCYEDVSSLTDNFSPRRV